MIRYIEQSSKKSKTIFELIGKEEYSIFAGMM